MLSQRQLFLNHQAQTSPTPLMLEIEKAEGVYLFDTNGKKYIDLISGIAVSNVGHRHPKVINAIQSQLDKHLHLMVYGEYVQYPQVQLAKYLAELLPKSLSSSYFVNSGAEAIEGALKLAKRFTGRTQLVSFKNAYHGSTHGALSMMGSEEFKNAFRPLLPDTLHLEFNIEKQLEFITTKTACVLVEPIQGEAGVRLPSNDYLKKLRKRCDEVGALLIFDEIQTGAGRTGAMFAFEKQGVVPDILCLAKGLGGGMPIGVFISSQEIMNSLTHDPILGHITTFGGHPVSCAAALATLKVIQEENLLQEIPEKEKLIRSLLTHKLIKELRGEGLMFAVEFGNTELNMKVIERCISKGVITDWFLFCNTAMRIAPPLTVTQSQLTEAIHVIVQILNEIK